jgi:hypothetical membrane protein
MFFPEGEPIWQDVAALLFYLIVCEVQTLGLVCCHVTRKKLCRVKNFIRFFFFAIICLELKKASWAISGYRGYFQSFYFPFFFSPEMSS